MGNLTVCPQCGAKNRLQAAEADRAPRCGKCRHPLAWIVAATDATFDRELTVGLPVLVDFWAPWCGPCRMIEPTIEAVAADLAGRLKVVKLNTEDNPKTADRFRIQAIPTLIVFKDNEIVDTIRGVLSKVDLLHRVSASVRG